MGKFNRPQRTKFVESNNHSFDLEETLNIVTIPPSWSGMPTTNQVTPDPVYLGGKNCLDKVSVAMHESDISSLF